jgi:hypothetical protein
MTQWQLGNWLFYLDCIEQDIEPFARFIGKCLSNSYPKFMQKATIPEWGAIYFVKNFQHCPPPKNWGIYIQMGCTVSSTDCYL